MNLATLVCVLNRPRVLITVYPALDTSDDEHVFKPRGKRRGDEAWNPKARVPVGSSRGARPARQTAARRPPLTAQTASRGSLLTSPRPQTVSTSTLTAAPY